MEIKDAIMEMAASDPQYIKAVDAMESELARMPVVPEDLDEAIALLEFVLKNPDKYAEVLQAAVKDGVLDAGMAPEQFDQVFVVSLLVALYGLQDRLNERGFSRGGLSVAARKLQTGGRGGDSELVHVNRREAEMLRRMGGSGDVNPNTGLREYKGLKKLFKSIAPIALSFIAPGLGTAIGTALGASGMGASLLGGALMGAATSGLTGGDWKMGALMGGLNSGLGEAVGGAANQSLGLGLGQAGQAALGGGLVGAGAGALTGQGVLKGATQGAIGGALSQAAQGLGNSGTALGRGLQAAGRTFGQGLTAGYDPKSAALAGAASGLASGLTYKPKPETNFGLKPSDSVLEGLKLGGQSAEDLNFGQYKPNYLTGGAEWVPGAPVDYSLASGAAPSGMVQQPSGAYFNENAMADAASRVAGPMPTGGAPESSALSLKDLGKYGALAMTASSLMSAPPPIKQAVQGLDPAQQEYFNRPSIKWDWDKLQSDANAANLSLGQYMARNWPQVTSGVYNSGSSAPVEKARGGPLAAVARFARGSGSGRADTIDAKLSDGEYVIDAETVAMLGDGSNQEGAKRLDTMRQNIRSHKGKALAKGRFSPNAKSPLAYLKGAA